MKYIIMCGGDYPQWETPRHLLKICGEPIVARTVRLLREAGADDIYISAHDKRFSQYAPLLEHENECTIYGDNTLKGEWVNAFYPTEEPACYIMGDVVFSPEAIKTIVETETAEVAFFASAPPFSPLFIKPWAEPFAFKVVNQRHFRESIEYVKRNRGMFNRSPIAWELWQVINRQNPNVINYNNYVAINDYSCDVDYPEDVQKIEGIICSVT